MSYPFLGLGFNSWTQKFSRGSAAAAAAVAAFLEYVTTSDTSSFTLLSTGTVDYEVDWGDGTTESLTTNNPTHTYSSAGEYTIKVTPAEGSTYRPYFNNAVSDTSIASVSGTGGSQLGTNIGDAWEGASNMTSFSSNIDIPSVTNFRYTWSGCSSLTSFPLIDTSSGVFLNGTWNGCSSLTSFPQLDTSSGTSFNFTWYGCYSLTSFPLLNTSSGTSFDSAWRDCTGLTSFPQLDVSSGTNFAGAWRNCTGLISFPLLNTSSVTTFLSAWQSCSGLTSFPANMFDTTGTLVSTAFANAFSTCSLTAQSIENILVSLDTNGASNITLGISGGSNAGYSTWTAAAQTALANLQGKGWTVAYNA